MQRWWSASVIKQILVSVRIIDHQALTFLSSGRPCSTDSRKDKVNVLWICTNSELHCLTKAHAVSHRGWIVHRPNLPIKPYLATFW